MLSHAILPKTALAKEIDFALSDGDCGFSCVKTGVYLNRSIFVFSAYTAYEFCSFISTGLIGVVHSIYFSKDHIPNRVVTGEARRK